MSKKFFRRGLIKHHFAFFGILMVIAFAVIYGVWTGDVNVISPHISDHEKEQDVFKKEAGFEDKQYFIEKRKSENDGGLIKELDEEIVLYPEIENLENAENQNSGNPDPTETHDQHHENELEDFDGSDRTENSDHKMGTYTDEHVKQELKSILKNENIALPTKTDQKTFVFEKYFDFSGEDIMIYLHIQKTGGTTFGRQLVENLPNLCEPRFDKSGKALKRRHCGRKVENSENSKNSEKKTDYTSENTWIFSRFSTGWACGLHADYTELNECLPEYWESRYKQMNLSSFADRVSSKKVKWITTLRDPVRRYISEWQHVSRGATWKNSKLRCDGKNHGWIGRKDFERSKQARISDQGGIFDRQSMSNAVYPYGFSQVQPCWEIDGCKTGYSQSSINQQNELDSEQNDLENSENQKNSENSKTSQNPDHTSNCGINSWKGVTLNTFLNCSFNLAANRQVRMLADLSEVGINCYSDIFPLKTNTKYSKTMARILESAKKNLRDRISFFTLTEYQRLSQYLFEKTFNKNFNVKFVQKESTVAGSYMGRGDGEVQKISEAEVERIRQANKYDIELYKYAKEIFHQRIKYFRKQDCESDNADNEFKTKNC